MENENIYLFKIISAALKGSAVPYLMDDIDYAVLFQTAARQGLTNFLCEGLKEIFLPEKISASHKEAVALQKAAHRDYHRFLHLFAAGAAPMPCIPVGGAALRGLYPDPTLRESRDFDILIDPADREKARDFAVKSGFSHVRECEGADYFFKPPATRIVLKTDYLGLNLWAKAQRSDKGLLYGLSPEDRYVAALYALKTAIDAGRGQAKLAIDVFVLYFACDHLFHPEYIKSEVDRLGLGFFETQMRDMYDALILEKKGVHYDTGLFSKLFAVFPKKLPPKYVSPEKLCFIKKVKKILLLTGISLTALTAILLFMLFNNTFGLGGKRNHESEGSDPPGSAASETESVPPYISYNNGIYYGETNGENPHGYGKMEYYSGDVYEGVFADGKKQGYGVFFLFSGGKYEGNFENDAISGEGTFYYSDGGVVHGTFTDGMPNGRCQFLYADGSLYEGDLANGVREGRGTFTYQNGDVYTGEFSKGDKTGSGTYTWADGSVFTGTWENNTEIKGTFRDNLGTYEGGFKNGAFSGQGKYTYANGDVYVGEFEKGLQNDQNGTLTYATGGKYTGAFVNGVFHGNGTMSLPNGDKVTGNFIRGKLNGDASYYYAEQDITQVVVYEDGEIVEYKNVVY